jgi:hypothetical protein
MTRRFRFVRVFSLSVASLLAIGNPIASQARVATARGVASLQGTGPEPSDNAPQEEPKPGPEKAKLPREERIQSLVGDWDGYCIANDPTAGVFGGRC